MSAMSATAVPMFEWQLSNSDISFTFDENGCALHGRSCQAGAAATAEYLLLPVETLGQGLSGSRAQACRLPMQALAPYAVLPWHISVQTVCSCCMAMSDSGWLPGSW